MFSHLAAIRCPNCVSDLASIRVSNHCTLVLSHPNSYSADVSSNNCLSNKSPLKLTFVVTVEEANKAPNTVANQSTFTSTFPSTHFETFNFSFLSTKQPTFKPTRR